MLYFRQRITQVKRSVGIDDLMRNHRAGNNYGLIVSFQVRFQISGRFGHGVGAVRDDDF